MMPLAAPEAAAGQRQDFRGVGQNPPPNRNDRPRHASPTRWFWSGVQLPAGGQLIVNEFEPGLTFDEFEPGNSPRDPVFKHIRFVVFPFLWGTTSGLNVALPCCLHSVSHYSLGRDIVVPDRRGEIIGTSSADIPVAYELANGDGDHEDWTMVPIALST